MTVRRVMRTRDHRIRVEIHHDRRVNLYDRGHLVLRRVTIERAGAKLAELGITLDDLVED